MKCVYKIINLINDKVYIGSTGDFKKRVNTHRSRLRKGSHDNAHLQAAWNRYGAATFRFEVIEEVQISRSLVWREQYWIDNYRSYDSHFGYNLKRFAGQTMLGFRFSEESKRKMSERRKGKPSPVLGYKHSEATKQNWSEQRKKNPAYQWKGKRVNDFWKGRTHTEESKSKMSEGLKSYFKEHTPWNAGKKMDQEQLAQLRAWAQSDEVREQRRQNALAYWAKRRAEKSD